MAAPADRAQRLAALRARLADEAPDDGPGPGGAGAAQRRLWLVHDTDPTGAALAVAVAATIDGGTDAAALRAALDAVVARHPALRTRFELGDDGDLRAVADLAPRCPVTTVDVLDPDLPELDAVARQAVRAGTDIAREHPIRVVLLERAGAVHGLVVVVHHLAWDDGCWVPFLADLARAHRGEVLPPGPDPATVWARLEPSPQEQEERRAHWRAALAGARFRVLPGEPAPAEPGPNAALEVTLGAGVELAPAAARMGTSPFTLLLTAFRVALDPEPGPRVVAVPVLRRDHPAARDCVAYLGNTLAMPCALPDGGSGRDAVHAVGEQLLDALAHADLDLAEQVRLAPGASTGLEVGVTIEETDVALELDGARTELRPVRSGVSHFPLMLIARSEAGRWTLRVEYLPGRVDRATAARLLTATARHVEALVATPDVVLRPGAPRAVAAPASVERPGAVDLIARQVERVPAATAVSTASSGDGRTLRYDDLWAASGAVAATLRARGAGTDTVVACLLRRAPEAVVATLGVLRSGAAVTEVNPDLPSARIARLLESAGTLLCLTDDDALGEHAEHVAATGVVVVPLREALDGTPAADLPPPHPDAVAAVIHTSGSTGRPKPVALTHAGLGAHLRWFLPTHFDGGRPRWLQTSAPGFDISLGEVLCTLAVGGEVIVAPPGVERDPDAFVSAVLDADASVVHAVPTQLEHVLRAALERGVTELGMLSWIPVGGEPFPGGLADRFRDAYGGIGLTNFYGPTETTVCVTGLRLHGRQGDRVIGLGTPKTGTDLTILDAALQPVPDGTVGELHVGGEALARGYHGRPGATAERFVPGAGGCRRYRTGDLVRRTPAGLEFVGRVDDQTKIRGIRVEPGEIEAVLRDHPEVRSSAVVVAGDQVTAYVTAHEAGTDPAPLAERVRLAAADTLPGALVPAHVVVLDELPTTAHGKIDRGALPLPGTTPAPVGDDVPEDAPERVAAVAAVLGEVLGRDDVAPDASFFALGGHSLLVMRAIALLRERVGLRVSVRDVFAAPTPAGLAARCGAEGPQEGRAAGGPAAGGPAAGEAPVRPARPPLTLAQRRLWVIDRMSGPAATYNVPIAVDLRGHLDAAALRGAVADLGARHEVLRTRYPDHDGTGWQEVLEEPPATASLTVAPEHLDEDLRTLGEVVLDLAVEVPLRITLLAAAPGHHVLLVVLHHVACDDRTARILVEELAELYAARVEGRTPDLDAPAQMVDLALAEVAAARRADDVRDRATAFWRDALAGAPPLPAVLADRPRPAVPADDGGLVTFRLGPAVRSAVEALAGATGSTPFLVLQTALAALLARLGAGPDVVLGTPCSTRAAGDRTIGLFVNMIVLRTDLGGSPTFREAVGRARDAAAGAYDHADLSFDRILDAAGVDRSPAAPPLVSQIVQLRDTPGAARAAGGVTWATRPSPVTTAKYDLAWDLEPRDADDGDAGGYHGELVFRRERYDEATARHLVDLLVADLAALLDDPDRPLEVAAPSADGVGPAPEASVAGDAELAAALRALPGVRDAAVVAVDTGRARGHAAYVVLDGDPGDPGDQGEERLARLRRAAGDQLPADRVPGAFALLDVLPRTPDGEVDLDALPPAAKVTTGALDPPLGPTEEALAELFAGVLAVHAVGRTDNFFALGGDSISSIQIASRARGQGHPISAALVFAHPTVEALAAAAAGARDAAGGAEPALPAAPMSASGLDSDTLLSLLGGADADPGRGQS